MSRIGKKSISIPAKVKVEINGSTVKVEGPKGKLSQTFAPVVTITQKDGTLSFAPVDDSRFARTMYGTVRSIVAGMITGAEKGYEKELEIQGVGFKANLKGKQLDLALGYSHPCIYDIPEGVKITVTDQTKIKVEGASKQAVGQATATIFSFYPVEPYKGKGVRIVGRRVRRKEGKTVA